MSRNRLDAETSPYLLQHKDNPVHWRPWAPEAFAEARRLDRPVLLSVGYAACHWCHVMAHESFEDPDTAALMNDLFINIKVDREERPDVDALYMAALHRLGEQGGWPLTMFLTPDAEPFWGGTYFPRTAKYGRPAFSDLLREVARVYREERHKALNNAAALRSALAPRPAASGATPDITQQTLAAMASRIAELFDPVYGGLNGTPKFPNAAILDFMWKAGLRLGLEPCLTAVETTLVHLCQGGIYDHLGGGMARYAVERTWLVPHFEKMLYDNALLIGALTEAWKETGRPLFRRRVEETADWLLREMTAEGGGFAASLDADSEGREGKFYVWSKAEIDAVLGAEDGAFFAKVYGVSESGSWEGVNILNRLHALDDLPAAQESRLAELRILLLAERSKRVRPGWDDKVLADWNGLAIASLAKAADAFQVPRWLEAARRAYDFVGAHMEPDSRLRHSFRAGRSGALAVSTDYANMIDAAMTLHQVTGEEAMLADARRWAEVMHRHHWAPELGGYCLTADDAPDIIIRPLSAQDDAAPNANATMLANLTALHLLTGEEPYRERAEALDAGQRRGALESLVSHAGFMSGLMDLIEPQHIMIAGTGGQAETAALGRALNGLSLPGAVVHRLQPGGEDEPLSPAARSARPVDGKLTVYVCAGARCLEPVTRFEALQETLRRARRMGGSEHP